MTVPAVGSRPCVSVMIAAYNAQSTIGLAIRSALAEAEVAEVWVIDDRSTDDTVMEALASDDGSGRLRVIGQDVNGGPARARNRALALSGCPWVCVLDADDYFLPGRIGRLLRHADGLVMIADELLRIEAGDPPPPPPQIRADGLDIDFAGFVEGNVSRPGQYREELGFIKPLMDRAFLVKHGLEYDPALRLGEDYHLYAQILAKGGRLRLLPPQGYVAVTRSDSLSGCHTIADLQSLRDGDRALLALPGITPQGRRALRRHYRSVDQRLQWRRLIDRVKAGDPIGALSTFTSVAVAGFLIARLGEQARVRFRRLTRPTR